MRIVLSCLSSGFFKLVVVSFCWRERSHWLAGSSLLHYITDFKSRVIALIKGLILDPPSSLLDQAFVRLASVLPASDLLPTSAVTVLRRPFPPSCSGSHGAVFTLRCTSAPSRCVSQVAVNLSWKRSSFGWLTKHLLATIFNSFSIKTSKILWCLWFAASLCCRQ